MDILLFIFILVALIVVHEFGHFVVAKLAKMRVEEFGIGYPPRALTYYRKDGTDYTLNWLPFGGFVKIYGEDDSASGTPHPDSFAAKPYHMQALVLVAGILMNIVFAWALFSMIAALGVPRALSGAEALATPGAELVVSRVVPLSPADKAGIVPGDTIVRMEGAQGVFESVSAEEFTAYVAQATVGEELTITLQNKDEARTTIVSPQTGIVPDAPERAALGVGVASVAMVKSPWWQAPLDGLQITINATQQVAVGLVSFFAGIVSLNADLSQVSGPVGIVGAVGDASTSGLVALLSLTAIISINLALVNLLPVPALDGGRLLFVLIEAVRRKPIPQGIAASLNTVGFALLLLLMLVVTASDIFKLLG